MSIVTPFNKKQLKKHILSWAIILAYVNLDAPIPGTWTAQIIGASIEAMNYIFLFYGLSLYVFPKFWVKQRIHLIIVSVFIFYGFYTLITYFNYLKIIPALDGYTWHEEYPAYDLLIENIFLFFIVCLAAISYFFYQYSIYKFKWQAEREKSLLVKELNFLKNQFNSHITFNFLNYCYSKIHQELPQIAESIGVYSDMLRYSLQSQIDKKIPVLQEITNIENFIYLHNSINAKVDTKFDYSGNTTTCLIVPRILTSFMEHVFKQDVCQEENTPVEIKLKVSGSKVVFAIRSKVDPVKKNMDIGFENIKQLLELYYINKYTLKNEVKDGTLLASLQLDTDMALVQNDQLNSKNIRTDQDTLTDLEIDVKPLMRLNKKQIKTHLIVWLLIIAYGYMTDPIPGNWLAEIIGSATIHLNYMFAFYSLSLFNFPKFWKNSWFLLTTSILFTFLIYSLISYLNFMIIIPKLGGYTSIQEESLTYFLQEIFYFFIITGLAGTASFFIRYGLYKLKLQAEREKSLLLKEIYFLKEQFNSDLTFNFLSYCYNNIQPHFPETAKSISYFAGMLKYTLKTGPKENVSLSKEIVYIENFIRLQKLLSSKVFADFEYQGKMEDKQILPRILVTFVENAFKHGLYNDPDQPIRMKLKVDDDQLTFRVNNRKNRSKKAASTHKGIENVKQILELHYANNHELKQAEEKEFFSIELKIRLSV